MTVELPGEVRAALARALGAYIHATPAKELPPKLKRWRNFRPQALSSRADEVLPALEDDALRKLVVRWLDDKPSLGKKDAELLRLAAEGERDWEARATALLSTTRKTKRPGSRDQPRDADLERERKRTATAKSQLRALRDEGRAALSAERRRTRELETALASSRRELDAAKATAVRAATESRRLEGVLDRERRRNKAALERRGDEVEGLKARLRDARRELADLRRRVRELERATPPKPRPGRRSMGGSPRREARKPLTAPKGLLDEAPETLAAWLSRPRVTLLVDGYNVAKAEGGFTGTLADQRDRLVDAVARMGRRFETPAVVVFDGADVAPGTRRRSRRGVKIAYSKPDESADDHLVALVKAMPPDPVIVVTSDRELQERARSLGATTATSTQFLELVR